MSLTKEDKSYELYCQGLDQFEKGNLDESLDLFLESLSLNRHFKTFERIYNIYVQKGMKKEAFEAITNAYNENTKNLKVACEYAKVLSMNGELKRALSIIEGILRINSNYGPAKKLKDKIMAISQIN